jgi:hypothetical protein
MRPERNEINSTYEELPEQIPTPFELRAAGQAARSCLARA